MTTTQDTSAAFLIASTLDAADPSAALAALFIGADAAFAKDVESFLTRSGDLLGDLSNLTVRVALEAALIHADAGMGKCKEGGRAFKAHAARYFPFYRGLVALEEIERERVLAA